MMNSSRAIRIYRILSRFLPMRFRVINRERLESTFLAMYEGNKARSPGARLRFWISIAWDLAYQGIVERLSQLRMRRQPNPNRSTIMATLFSDIRFSLRSLKRQPSFSIMVVLLVALGIGGNAVVFRIVNGLFFQPLPFQNGHQLVDLDETAPQWNLEFVGMRYMDFARWREENETFQGMAVYTAGGRNYSDGSGANRVGMVFATHDLLDVLGLTMREGRFFGPDEDVPEGPHVAVITDGFWKRAFGAGTDVIGRTIALDGIEHEIVGVLPPAAGFVENADVWVPLGGDPNEHDGWYLSGIGRLKEGVSIETARADLLRIHKSMIPTQDVNEITSPHIHDLRERFIGDFKLGSGALLAAVSMLLLMACANIAGLTLARSLGRSREIGIRLSIGASRSRIVAQLLTESLVLAAIGGAAGLGLGAWGSRMAVFAVAREFPAWFTFSLDVRFLLFIVGLVLASAMVFGLVPAVQAARVPAASALQQSSSRITDSRLHRRMLNGIVAFQVMLAATLLVTSALLYRDMSELRGVDLGFDSDNLLTYRVNLPQEQYSNSDAVSDFARRHVEALEALPGIVSASVASSVPMSGHWGWFFAVEGESELTEEDSSPVVLARIVPPSYFETLGVRLERGRLLNDLDEATAARDSAVNSIVINQTFARLFFGDRDPIGRTLTSGGLKPFTVVGVSHDVRHYGADQEMRPAVYVPWTVLPRRDFVGVVRVGGEPDRAIPQVRASLQELDPSLPIYDVQTMGQRMSASLFTRRASMWMVMAFSITALILAVAGIYGVVSFGVGQRAREIALRMALGAQRAQVLGSVLRQGLAVVGLGTLTGVSATYALSPVLERLLVSIDARQIAVYVTMAVGLLLIAAIANLIPAIRASRFDPTRVLRA